MKTSILTKLAAWTKRSAALRRGLALALAMALLIGGLPAYASEPTGVNSISFVSPPTHLKATSTTTLSVVVDVESGTSDAYTLSVSGNSHSQTEIRNGNQLYIGPNELNVLTVTAAADADPSVTASINITVQNYSSISIDPVANQTVNTGGTLTYTGSATTVGGLSDELVYTVEGYGSAKSSNTKMNGSTLTVGADETAAFLWISVEFRDLSTAGTIATRYVTVNPAPAILDVTLDKTNVSVVRGSSTTFAATVGA